MEPNDKEMQTENLIVKSKYIQTKTYDNEHTKKSEPDRKTVKVTAKLLILTLPRCDLDDEQLENFKDHAKESGMSLEEFLVEMPKVIEGYIRLVDDKNVQQ